MAAYIDTQDLETGQGRTLEPGILEEDSGGDLQQTIGGEAPNNPLYLPQNPPSRFPGFIVQPLACFIPWIFIRCHIIIPLTPLILPGYKPTN